MFVGYNFDLTISAQSSRKFVSKAALVETQHTLDLQPNSVKPRSVEYCVDKINRTN